MDKKVDNIEVDEKESVSELKKEIKKHSLDNKINRNTKVDRSTKIDRGTKVDRSTKIDRGTKDDKKDKIEKKDKLDKKVFNESKKESNKDLKKDSAKDSAKDLIKEGPKMPRIKNEEAVISEINYRKSANEKKKDIKVSASRSGDKKKENVITKFTIPNIPTIPSHKKEIEEKERIKKSKVTDFDDVKKVAMANEKKRKKEQYIQHVKERYEKLQTPKARICITAIFLVIGFIVFVAMTVINDIEIDEGKHYTEEQVKRMVIKNIIDYNSVYLFLKYRYSEHEEVPFVEYIDVEWVNKNAVKLKVYDKNIIGCTSFMNEYVYFDKDGYVVETSSKKEKDILYITGIEFEELALNSRIKVDDDKIFDTILTITQQISKYKLEVDELKFDKSFNLTLYSGDITVLLGKQETYDEQLAKLKSLLEEAKKENLSGVLHMEKYKEGQDRIIFDKN